MNQLLATYELGGELHRIELVPRRGGAVVLDRSGGGAPGVVSELDPGEGRAQALAVLHAGGYLERARGGEVGLCRTLDQGGDERLGRTLDQGRRRSERPAARAA